MQHAIAHIASKVMSVCMHCAGHRLNLPLKKKDLGGAPHLTFTLTRMHCAGHRLNLPLGIGSGRSPAPSTLTRMHCAGHSGARSRDELGPYGAPLDCNTQCCTRKYILYTQLTLLVCVQILICPQS